MRDGHDRIRRGPRGATQVVRRASNKGGDGTISVGDVCVVQRRSAWTGRVELNWDATVVSVGTKRVYIDDRQWFSLDDPKREVRPKYLDYLTVVAEIKAGPSE